MESLFITFRSVTWAQRGEQMLNRAGFRCGLQRTPRWMEEQGCGYALRVHAREETRVLELLRGAGLPLRHVYRQDREGQMEVVV